MNNYYYNLLEKRLQGPYRILVEGLQSHKERVILPLVATPEEVERLIDTIVLEHPNISCFQFYDLNVLNGHVLSVNFTYLLTAEKQRAANEETLAQAERIAAYARDAGSDPLSRIHAVQKYFVSRVTYHESEVRDPFLFYPAGALLYGKAVCLGISHAFKIVMDLLGIPAITVRGEVEGESHAWNMVYYDGKWRFLDMTYEICAFSQIGETYFDQFEALPTPTQTRYIPWDAYPLPKAYPPERMPASI